MQMFEQRKSSIFHIIFIFKGILKSSQRSCHFKQLLFFYNKKKARNAAVAILCALKAKKKIYSMIFVSQKVFHCNNFLAFGIFVFSLLNAYAMRAFFQEEN